MCELTEVTYMPGDVVWVKLGNCWWPGEVKDMDTLPEEIMPNLKKKPLAVVKFFGEDAFEYVRNLDNIYHYNNRRKMEFIKRGMDLSRAKSKQGSTVMEKFPTDVITAESLTDGDVNILSTEAFMPKERPHYKDLFGTPKKKSPKKNGPGRPSLEKKSYADKKSDNQTFLGKIAPLIQLKQRITHPRFLRESDHEVRIRQQPSSERPSSSEDHAYKCQQCDFSTSRQNVFILHCKAHRDNVIQSPSKTLSSPSAKPRKTPKSTSTSRTSIKSTVKKITPSTSAPPKEAKEKKPPKDASDIIARRKIFQANKKITKKGHALKESPKVSSPVKPPQTKERDLEKRNRILADWDDEDEEEEKKEFKKLRLDMDSERSETAEQEEATSSQTEQPVSDAASSSGGPVDRGSVYDLIEDSEEFAPPPRLSETKRTPPERISPVDTAESLQLDKDVSDLLQETAVPELPQVPTLNLPGVKDDHTAQMTNIPVEDESEVGAIEETVELNPIDPIPQESETPMESGPTVNGTEGETSIAEASVTSTVCTPAVHTIAAPTVSKANGILEIASESATDQSLDMQEAVVDPNSETATYVLVTIDDSGGFQQFQSIEGIGNTTLLAYDSSQGEDGNTRTLYIDPSQLGGSAAGLENLFLAIDATDESGASVMQLQPQQVTLQVASSEPNLVMNAEHLGTKAKQDILAVALANTQVLQPSPMEAVSSQDAVVKVTNAAQSPVMTPRVAESPLAAAAAAKPASQQQQQQQQQQQHETAATIITLSDAVSGIR